MFLVIVIIAGAAVHFLRPDISNAVTDLISQKYHQYTRTPISDRMATTYNLLQRLSANLLQPVERLTSFPWMKYYNWGQGLIHGFVSSATWLGHPNLAYWSQIGIYIGVFVMMVILAAILFWFLRIIWAVIAGVLSTIWAVLAWVFYPFTFIYRLFFGRNGRPVAPDPHAGGQRAPKNAITAGAGGH